MEFNVSLSDSESKSNVRHQVVSTKQYTYEQLAEIYNQTRVDYIVPMPMNAKRVEEYVTFYDIDLAASIVVLNEEQQEAGICMLGVRDARTWVTRLGVLPVKRRRGTGRTIMNHVIAYSKHIGARCVQLEVIKGNEPAHNLFTRCGFEATRELLVIRRPPGVPPANVEVPPAEVETLSQSAIATCLAARHPQVSWVEETPSMLNAGNLEGLHIRLATGKSGWVVFRHSIFQLTHIVLDPQAQQDSGLALALLYYLYQQYPMHDTKFENLPHDDPTWPAFLQMGFVESFRRIEMVLKL